MPFSMYKILDQEVSKMLEKSSVEIQALRYQIKIMIVPILNYVFIPFQ